MRLLLLLSGLFLFVQIQAQHRIFYDFSAKTIDGEKIDFSILKGKKVLIVNTASECMLTPQYKKLQELYEEYGGDDFEIMAFPSNDFRNQDPGSNQQIKAFCEQFQISFMLMEKISVKGDSIHPLYKWLTQSSENGSLDSKVKWNFQKFLVDEQGHVVESLGPAVSPTGKKIVNWLKE